jgi:hypothetical protein
MQISYDLDAMRDSIKRFENEIVSFEVIVDESQLKRAVLEAAKKEEDFGGYDSAEQVDELIKSQQDQVDYYKEQVRAKQAEIGEYSVLIQMQEINEKQTKKV